MAKTPTDQNDISGLKNRRFDDLPWTGQAGLVFALRVAATMEGAPKRCRRVACRRGGQCALRVDPDDFCSGGLTRETLEKAALGLVFVHRFVSDFPAILDAPQAPDGWREKLDSRADTSGE
jgi:hypothetical protein